MAPSQSCESMHSIQSMSSIRLGQWAASGAMSTCSAQAGCHDDSPASDRDDMVKMPADVVEQKSVSGYPVKTVSYEDNVVVNGDAAQFCSDNASCKDVQEGDDSKSSHEGVDIEVEAVQPTLVDLTPIAQVRPTISSEEADVIVGDKLIDFIPETGLDSTHPETNGGTEGELVGSSPVTDSLPPAPCPDIDATRRDGGIPAQKTGNSTPFLTPCCASTPTEVVAPSDDCVNGLPDGDAPNCNTERKLVGNGSLVHEIKMADHAGEPENERTPCAAVITETNCDPPVATSSGNGENKALTEFETDRCNDADSIAHGCDNKDATLATRIEANSDDNVDAVG